MYTQLRECFFIYRAHPRGLMSIVQQGTLIYIICLFNMYVNFFVNYCKQYLLYQRVSQVNCPLLYSGNYRIVKTNILTTNTKQTNKYKAVNMLFISSLPCFAYNRSPLKDQMPLNLYLKVVYLLFNIGVYNST